MTQNRELLIFNKLGTGTYEFEGTGKFRWKAAAKDEVAILERFSAVDSEGNPLPRENKKGLDRRLKVNTAKTELTETDGSGKVLVLQPQK